MTTGVLLVVAHQSDDPLLVVIVGQGHGRAEEHAGGIGLVCRIDHPG